MTITTFVLIVSVMGPFGWTESSHYAAHETRAACVAAGEAGATPWSSFRCERGRLRPDLAVGWSSY